MSNEVEPHIWKAASAAVRRYFRGAMGKSPTVAIEKACYQTGYIMGFRAGYRAAKREVRRG